MIEEKTAGILLQAIPYLGQKRILKILTPEEGLLSFIAQRSIAPVFTTPFVYAEWVYKKNQRELYPLNDATLLDDLAALKQTYAHVTAAGQMAQDLLRTQLPNKSCPELFALTLACFRKLPLFQDPNLLLAMFRLKLLSSEGLISELPTPLTELLHTKSFNALAAQPNDPHACHQAHLLFEEHF